MDSVSDPVCINGEENGEEWTEPANEELDEDIFSYLSNEEQECLKYLMDTIDSLEADMVADDQEERTGTHCPYVLFLDNADDRDGGPNIEPEQEEVTPAAEEPQNPNPVTADHNHQLEMPTSAPLDIPAIRPQTLVSPRLARSSSHQPAHVRKFDTILRSGVSVQELRAQVLARFGGTCTDESSNLREGPRSPTSLFPEGSDFNSPRVDALQKLGFLKTPEEAPTPPGSPREQKYSQSPPDSTMSSPQMSSTIEDKDHQEALKKLGLLRL
ncbi:proline and serine-rich protein 2-like [Huso huso]|uniref:Proline and serine-rich protein 2-like n=1 Tax=Huso huso TaxID=61971 RepID=A0ABR0Z6X9_HUSHU